MAGLLHSQLLCRKPTHLHASDTLFFRMSPLRVALPAASMCRALLQWAAHLRLSPEPLSVQSRPLDVHGTVSCLQPASSGLALQKCPA